MRNDFSGYSFATVLSRSVIAPEQTNSVKLTSSTPYYKINLYSEHTSKCLEADVSGKKAFLTNKRKSVWRLKGQLERILSARNGILIFCLIYVKSFLMHSLQPLTRLILIIV